VHIVDLTKPVPDPAAAAERLGQAGRLDRAASPTVVNGNDDFALVAALKLTEAHCGEVSLLTMAPPVR
jgi:electron transfer flavoprotein beta subunit